MESMIITCIQCGAEFEFSIEDQIRYKKMNFDDPKRCHACRKKKLKNTDSQNKKSNHRKRYEADDDEY